MNKIRGAGERGVNNTMSTAVLIHLKIGRQVYDITEVDRFLDNGVCIQIITQHGPFKNYYYTVPKLTKKATREIGAFAHVNHTHKYGEGCKVFSLRNSAITTSQENDNLNF